MQYTEYDVKMIIRAYNAAARANLQFNSKPNQEAVQKALDVADSRRQLESFVSSAVSEKRGNYGHVTSICGDFVTLKSVGMVDASGKIAKAEPEVKTVTVTEKVQEFKSVSDEEMKAFAGLQLVGELAKGMLEKVNLGNVEESITEAAKKKLDAYIHETYGAVPKKVELDVNGKKKVIPGVIHKAFDDVLKSVFAGVPVYMVGPAGTGKNVIAKQVSEALELPFYFTGAVTQEYKLMGFTDAMGKYQESQFYKAFKDGGLFFFDELDCSIPEVVKAFNAAIGNRYCDFPAPIGRVEASENFRVVAAANTFGLGADLDYVGAYQQDGSTINRFIQIDIDYDPRIEEACSLGDSDLLEFCRKFRKATAEAGVRTIVSYRNIEQIAQLSSGEFPIDTKVLVKGCLTRALPKSDLRIIQDKMRGYGKYSVAFDELCK